MNVLGFCSQDSPTAMASPATRRQELQQKLTRETLAGDAKMTLPAASARLVDGFLGVDMGSPQFIYLLNIHPSGPRSSQSVSHQRTLNGGPSGVDRPTGTIRVAERWRPGFSPEPWWGELGTFGLIGQNGIFGAVYRHFQSWRLPGARSTANSTPSDPPSVVCIPLRHTKPPSRRDQ